MIRNNYWSGSKFADVIRGGQKPESDTSEGWKKWHQDCKQAHPIRYWIAEELLDKIQDVVYYPLDKFYSVKYWVLNRFVTKTHSLQSDLKKGEYWELDTRILHCLFDELRNFVEVEKAWMQVAWGEDEEVDAPWYAAGPLRTRTFRSAELGLKYLEWEASLKEESGLPTPQAKDATTIINLYNWWVNVRPNRPDPYEESGWSDYCSKYESVLDMLGSDVENTRPMLDTISIMEKAYYDEDTVMLIDLINIRTSLWT